MSCPTNTNSRNFIVQSGSLPEGYCPTDWQQFLDDLTQRLIVQSPLNQSSFATGSSMPSSNVGPWLKDCAQWFFYDDATGLYKIQLKGGFDNQAFYTANGSFTVPDNIYKIRVQAWGGGGGGGKDTSTNTTAGGSGGGYCMKIFDVVPAQNIPFVIGSGGSGNATPGGNGGNTTILTLIAGGGPGSAGGTFIYGQAGGTAAGGDVNITGEPGRHGDTTAGVGGQGGSAPNGGQGGEFIFPVTSLLNGGLPGGGGSGGYSTSGTGNGAGGGILIEW